LFVVIVVIFFFMFLIVVMCLFVMVADFFFSFQNQDGLVYADLDLAKARDSKAVPQRSDAVNYETIDFTKSPPLADPDPDAIESASDEETVPSKK
jgi:hypothetical protein